MNLKLTARDVAMMVIGLFFFLGAVVAGSMDRSLFGALAILPVMTILTALSGGYEVRRMGRFAGWGMALVAIGVLFALLALHPLMRDVPAEIAAVVYGVVALRRALWLVRQQRRAAALSIAVASVFLAGWSFAYAAMWPSFYDKQIVRGVTEFTAYQLSVREHSHRFDPMTPANVMAEWHDDFTTKLHRDEPEHGNLVSIDTSYARAGDHFLILVKRAGPLPFFPYNLFTSWPVYRADESGAIRAERVHTDRSCSPQAPVIVRAGDLRWLIAHEQENFGHGIALLQKLEGDAALGEAMEKGSSASRMAAIEAIYQSKDPKAVQRLLAGLHDRDPAVRTKATFYLELRRDPQTVPALVDALRDPVNDVIAGAGEALRQIHDARTLALVAPLLADRTLPELTRYQAAIVIGGVGGDQAPAILVPYLNDPLPRIRTSILVGLGYSRSALAVAPLVEASHLQDDELRNTAAFALGQLKLPQAKARLREMAASDPSANVRDTASRYSE